MRQCTRLCQPHNPRHRRGGPGGTLPVAARREDGGEVSFETVVRLDSETDLDYDRHGGILQMMPRQLTAAA